MTWRIVVNF